MGIPVNGQPLLFMSLLSKFQSVQPSLLYRHCQPLKNEMGVFTNPLKNKIKVKVLVFTKFRTALFAGSQVAPDCPSDNRSIKIRQRTEQWCNYFDKKKIESFGDKHVPCHCVHHKPPHGPARC
jgi:hypothetical protein